MTRLSLTTILVLALASYGCEEGRERPPSVNVSIVHAAKSRGGLDFFRGQTTRGKDVENMSFRSAAQRSYDADVYNMHVNVAASNSIGTELAAFTAELLPDNRYHIVIAESAGDILPLVVERPPFPTDATDAELTVVHAADAFGDVDVYIEPSGTDLASATPLGSASFGDDLAPATRAEGDYRLFLTPVGDPSTLRFRSTPFALGAGQSNLLVLTDGAGEGLHELVGVITNSAGSAQLIDSRLRSAARFINAASDRAARDIYVDEDFSSPLASEIAFGAVTAFETVAPGDREFNVTPTGNPSVVEHDQAASIVRGRLYTVLVADDDDGLTAATALEDRRPLRDTARFQILHGAGLLDTVAFFLAQPGTDVSTISPAAIGAAPTIVAIPQVVPGDYELTVTGTDTSTVLAGPIAVTLDAGGFYSVLALDAAGGSTIDIELLDDFN